MKTNATAHRILEVVYRDNRLVCTCGEVMAAADAMAWREHRLAVGLRTESVGQFFGHRRRG